MHEPEKFQQETIKAITDLQETFRLSPLFWRSTKPRWITKWH